jgi:deoxyribonuclease V
MDMVSYGMDYTPLHRWDVSLVEAERLQRELRERLVLQAPPGFAPRLAAGGDVSMNRDSPLAYAGFVVLEMAARVTVAEVAVRTEITFPYVPGFLSFREIPALAMAWQRLQTRPDVLIIDGHGTAHPRRMGVACHAGLVFNLPTIGCAKSILVGRYEGLDEERGATTPLVHRDEIVGMAVRTRARVSPVYVSPGHLIDLSAAVEIVLGLSDYREPETTRRAHRLVNAVRRADMEG